MTDSEIREALEANTDTNRANDNEGPFSIGQNVWPGISKLLEEAGEVVQICGKLIATGGRVDHWSGLDLGRALSEELGDLLAAIHFVMDHNDGDLDGDSILDREQAKRRLFERWHCSSEG